MSVAFLAHSTSLLRRRKRRTFGRRCFARVAYHVYTLRWRCWNCLVGAGEIKELRHVRLGCVTLCQVGQVETFLHQPEHCGEIHGRMRNEGRLGEWRHNHQRYPEAGTGEVARRMHARKIEP